MSELTPDEVCVVVFPLLIATIFFSVEDSLSVNIVQAACTRLCTS